MIKEKLHWGISCWRSAQVNTTATERKRCSATTAKLMNSTQNDQSAWVSVCELTPEETRDLLCAAYLSPDLENSIDKPLADRLADWPFFFFFHQQNWSQQADNYFCREHASEGANCLPRASTLVSTNVCVQWVDSFHFAVHSFPLNGHYSETLSVFCFSGVHLTRFRLAAKLFREKSTPTSSSSSHDCRSLDGRSHFRCSEEKKLTEQLSGGALFSFCTTFLLHFAWFFPDSLSPSLLTGRTHTEVHWETETE